MMKDKCQIILFICGIQENECTVANENKPLYYGSINDDRRKMGIGRDYKDQN